MAKNNLVGAWGEAQAAAFLQKKRYKVIARGFRCRFGEIDLVVANKKYLVFVEVKLRKSSCFADAREYVDLYKQRRLRTTADFYLSENPTHLQPRFDVVEIYAPDGVNTASPQILHMEDAFQ